MKGFIFLLVLFAVQLVHAQLDSTLFLREKQLSIYLTDLRKASDDLDKEAKNQLFKNYLLETIQLTGAFEYPFSLLKTIGTVKSPDNTFRFFNWNVEQSDETNKYYCYILRFDKKKKEWKTIELIDNSIALPPQPEDVLDETMWYGALYYKIIPVEKSSKTYYTLLGYDATSNLSHTKLIDVISFSGNHVKLGSPIFKSQDIISKRIFFEHSKKCVMSLTYDDIRSRIVFDHLSPETPNLEGFREFYVPDMSYDAYKFMDNKWILEEDVISINKPAETANNSVVRIDVDGNGKLIRHKEKRKWLDPSNPNAPAGQNIHTPALPEGTVSTKEKINKKKEESEFPPIRKRNRKQKSGILGTMK